MKIGIISEYFFQEFVDKVDFVLDYMAPCDQRSVPGDQIIVEEELQKLKPEDHIFVNEAHYVLKNLPPKHKYAHILFSLNEILLISKSFARV